MQKSYLKRPTKIESILCHDHDVSVKNWNLIHRLEILKWLCRIGQANRLHDSFVWRSFLSSQWIADCRRLNSYYWNSQYKSRHNRLLNENVLFIFTRIKNRIERRKNKKNTLLRDPVSSKYLFLLYDFWSCLSRSRLHLPTAFVHSLILENNSTHCDCVCSHTLYREYDEVYRVCAQFFLFVLCLLLLCRFILINGVCQFRLSLACC